MLEDEPAGKKTSLTKQRALEGTQEEKKKAEFTEFLAFRGKGRPRQKTAWVS